MRDRQSVVVVGILVLVVGAMSGMSIFISQSRMMAEVRIAEEARVRANLAEREAHAARSQARDIQNYAEARAGNESAVRSSEIQSLRRENEEFRSRIKAIEDVQKVKTDPQAQAQAQGPRGASVP